MGASRALNAAVAPGVAAHLATAARVTAAVRHLATAAVVAAWTLAGCEGPRQLVPADAGTRVGAGVPAAVHELVAAGGRVGQVRARSRGLGHEEVAGERRPASRLAPPGARAV